MTTSIPPNAVTPEGRPIRPNAYPTDCWGGTVREPTERAYLRAAFQHYFPRYARRTLLGGAKRRPDNVRARYDRERNAIRESLAGKTLEEYVLGGPEQYDFVLVNDRIEYARTSGPLLHLLEEMERHLAPHLKPGATIVEFGAGGGRNLVWLKSRHPQVRFVGLELSPASVELAREAAKRFALDIEIYEANVCEPLAVGPEHADAVYSANALEQMTKIFPRAVDNMVRMSKGPVFFFEPVCELYSSDQRGRISRWRARTLDRLRGLLPYLKEKGYTIQRAERMRTAFNPLNETCVVVVQK